MKLIKVAILGSTLLTPAAIAHQVHGILLVNGTESPRWKYVRDVAPMYYSNPWTYTEGSDYPKVDPQTAADIGSYNITCGREAFASASSTETANVLAGSEVGFRVSWDGNGEYGVFWHPGPAQVYLSRAPHDDVTNYQGGEGDWFKIAYSAPLDNQHWPLWGKHDFNFTIPETTPPGKYLMRIEHFMPAWEISYSQWYINCAQVNIIGPGGGTPSGFAKFPGTYKITDPGIIVPVNQIENYGLPADQMRLLDYVAPGPSVWTG